MKQKILIIEDENLIRKSLQKILTSKGAQVDDVANGKDGIKLIKQNNYDKVICDLMLQDITGFDVIEESKSKYNNQQISHIFIIMTAYSSPQVIEKAKKYGCHILNKPFHDINNAINLMLGEQK